MMKFLVTWRAHSDKRVDLWKLWSSMTPAQRADVGQDLVLIGRWHNPLDISGAAVLEATDAAALHRYLTRWAPLMDLDVVPVLDDEEGAVVAKQTLADLGLG